MEAEKIICCDRGDNDNALAAAILAGNNRRDNDGLYALLANQRNNNDPMAMAAMMNGGMGGQWNNPFIYLVWMMFAQRLWGNGCGENGGCNNPQIAALQNQMQDNHNSDLILQGIGNNTGAIRELAGNLNCDFNTLNSAICDVRGGIDRLAGQVGFSAERVINAVNMGDSNIIQALKDCCCQTQQSILRMGYEQQLATCQQTGELRNGQRDLGSIITQGFSSTAFQAQQDKCDIIRAGQDNTQRIIDTLNNHWNADLQQRYNDARLELSQLRQNATLIAALRTTTTTTATA
jgi:hypothetical protein